MHKKVIRQIPRICHCEPGHVIPSSRIWEGDNDHGCWRGGHVGASRTCTTLMSLQWRHNDLDGVSNHQPHACLLNRLFRRRSKKTSKLCVTGLCEGNSPVTGEFHKGPVARKMLPFDDVIMTRVWERDYDHGWWCGGHVRASRTCTTLMCWAIRWQCNGNCIAMFHWNNSAQWYKGYISPGRSTVKDMQDVFLL